MESRIGKMELLLKERVKEKGNKGVRIIILASNIRNSLKFKHIISIPLQLDLVHKL